MMSNDVKHYEKCPTCHGEWGGKGERYSSYKKGNTLLRKYFRCNVCGHTWSQDFKPEQPIIQTHHVNLETRLPHSQKPSTKRRTNK